MRAFRPIAGFLLLASVADAGPTFRTVVRSGDAAPTLPSGITFGFLADARINSSGHALFFADLAGAGTTGQNDSSIWSDRSGSLELITRKGDNSGLGATTIWAAIA